MNPEETARMGPNYGWMPDVGHTIPAHPPYAPGPGYPPTAPPHYPPPGGNEGLYPTGPPGYQHPPFAPPHHHRPPVIPCPVCQIPLTPPVYQCESGHTLCSACVERLDYCISHPDCMCPLDGPKIRNMAVEQQLAGYQHQHPYPCPPPLVAQHCPHHAQGCGFTYYSSDQLHAHMTQCRFRGYPYCSTLFGWRHCHQHVPRHGLLAHLRQVHGVEETDSARFSLRLMNPSFGGTVMWNPMLITALEEAILLKCEISQGLLCLTGYLLTMHEHVEWKKYQIKFQLDSDAKGARLEWTGRLMFQPLQHETGVPAEERNVNTFCIPLHLLHHYVTPASKLKIKVGVFHRDFAPLMEPDEEEQEALYSTKLTLHAKDPGDEAYYSRTAVDGGEEEEFAKYYSSEATCQHCQRLLLGQTVMYQCLQCPDNGNAAYFCSRCVETGFCHQDHLTVRISQPKLQPLAAVAFASAAGELR